MSSKDLENSPILFLYGKNTLAKLDNENLLKQLDYAVPGNNDAKLQMLLTINQAYANKDLDNTTAIMLTGGSCVGKSSLIKSISELANIPVIRMDLENILETSDSDKLNLDIMLPELLNTLYDEINSVTKLTKEEKQKYINYQKRLEHKVQKEEANLTENIENETIQPQTTSKEVNTSKKQSKRVKNEEILILKEIPNAEFTIVEFDNAEILLDKKYYKASYSNALQLVLVDQIKNPRIISPGKRTTGNFIYVFSSDLKESITRKDVGFRNANATKVDNVKLLDLGYSKKFVDILDNVIELKDLNEQDFEQYLLKEESHLHQSISSLCKAYEMNITIDKSAIKVVSKYLASNNKNLRGIEEVTRKLLAPHYISPKKGTIAVIDSTIATERLYSK